MPTLDLLFSEALRLLTSIESIMAHEGDDNWIRGIRVALGIMQHADGAEADKLNALKDVGAIYRTMHGGIGTFSDYFIWRDTVEGRQQVNAEFAELTRQLSTILDEARRVSCP